jgi:hypothetical protein
MGISPEEISFDRRGFPSCDPDVRRRLERIGATFLHGYHAAVDYSAPEVLARRLNRVDAEYRGFAFEGAAMALSVLDLLTPWKRDRWLVFVSGPGAKHVYMVHVGIGWALARLRWRVQPVMRRLHPLLRWLVVDGYGFHEGYFHWRRYVEQQARPERLSGYACRAFDQGLGRSLWFVNGADVARIPATIAAFPPTRRADLWSGVGLACAYAGGVDRAAIEALRRAAGHDGPHLAQGAIFAAKARQRAGNPMPHTALACDVLCGLPTDAAARLADRAVTALPTGSVASAYEVWRERIRAEALRTVEPR